MFAGTWGAYVAFRMDSTQQDERALGVRSIGPTPNGALRNVCTPRPRVVVRNVVAAVAYDHGYGAPVICTPEELMGD